MQNQEILIVRNPQIPRLFNVVDVLFDEYGIVKYDIIWERLDYDAAVKVKETEDSTLDFIRNFSKSYPSVEESAEN